MAGNMDDLITALKRAAWERSRSKADAAEKALRAALQEALTVEIEKVRVELSHHRDADFSLGAIFALDTLRGRLHRLPWPQGVTQ